MARKIKLLPPEKLCSDAFSPQEFIDPNKPYKLRLKDLRKETKLNQTEAGNIVCTSQKQYSRWETGSFDIPIFELCMFAIFYNRKVDYILGLSDDATPLYTEEERLEKIKSLSISRYFNRFDMWPVEGGKSVIESANRK